MTDLLTLPHLLLVDDDPSFCEALARALTRRGFEVTQTLDADLALQEAQRSLPSHAIVDLRLGEVSGLPLVRRLLECNPAMRIIVLTGYASISTAVEAVKLGALHYLAKPAEADEIIAAFQRDEGDADVDLVSNPMSVRRLTWEHIQKVLTDHGGNVSAAARCLGLHRRTLQRKLNKRPSPS